MLKNNKPQRRCVGCMESKDQGELIRLVKTPEGVLINPKRDVPGRGTYLCKRIECLEKAKKKKSIAKALIDAMGEEQIDELTKIIRK